jgi:hypothetical protein
VIVAMWDRYLETAPVIDKNLANQPSLIARKDAWEDAYRHTPHGTPVDLARFHSGNYDWDTREERSPAVE